MIHDYETIVSIAKIFYQKIKGSMLTSPPFSSTGSSSDMISSKNSSLDARLMDGSDSSDALRRLINSSTLGHLIPLSCGHNSKFKVHELEVLEYHIDNSLIAFEGKK